MCDQREVTEECSFSAGSR